MFAPFPCKADGDCAKGRHCARDARFKEIPRACRDRALGSRCRTESDCRADSECRHGMCRHRRLEVCTDDRDCRKRRRKRTRKKKKGGAEEEEVCVYGPEGLNRVCRRHECNKDKDCRQNYFFLANCFKLHTFSQKKKFFYLFFEIVPREGMECVKSRWMGRRCASPRSRCSDDSDCEPCETCARSPDMDRSTCRRTGVRCEGDGDCKEGQVCAVAARGHGADGKRRCHKVKINKSAKEHY